MPRGIIRPNGAGRVDRTSMMGQPPQPPQKNITGTPPDPSSYSRGPSEKDYNFAKSYVQNTVRDAGGTRNMLGMGYDVSAPYGENAPKSMGQPYADVHNKNVKDFHNMKNIVNEYERKK